MGGKRNITAGHSFERDIVEAFQKVGYPHVRTSRATNRTRDAEKVDLAYGDEVKHGRFPYNVQCKTLADRMAYKKVLESLPIIEGVRNVVIHKQTEKKGNRFMHQGTFTFMHAHDFFSILEELEHYKNLAHARQNSPD